MYLKKIRSSTTKFTIGEKIECKNRGDIVTFYKYQNNKLSSFTAVDSIEMKDFPVDTQYTIYGITKDHLIIGIGIVEFYFNCKKYNFTQFANEIANGDSEIAFSLWEELRKNGKITKDDPVVYRELIFCDEKYTLKEFANKMTNGDIKSAETVLENLINSGSAKWIDATTFPKVGQNYKENPVLSSSNKLKTINMSSSTADKTFYNLVANIDNKKLAHDINELMLRQPIRKKDNRCMAVVALSTLLAEHALKLGDEEEYLVYRDIVLKWNEDDMWWPTMVETVFNVAKDSGVTDTFFDDIISYLEANANDILKDINKDATFKETFYTGTRLYDKQSNTNSNKSFTDTLTQSKTTLDFCGKIYTLEKFASEFCEGDINEATTVINTLIKQGRAKWVSQKR